MLLHRGIVSVVVHNNCRQGVRPESIFPGYIDLGPTFWPVHCAVSVRPYSRTKEPSQLIAVLDVLQKHGALDLVVMNGAGKGIARHPSQEHIAPVMINAFAM